MKKIIGIVICICMMVSTVSLAAEQDDTHTTDVTPQSANAQLTINIQSFYFDPDLAIIDLPTNVTWINKDVAPHSVVSDAGDFDSHTLLYNEKFTYTIYKAGLYSYHCGLHPQVTGKIFAAQGGNQPPLKPIITGPTNESLTKKVVYNFTTSTWDPEQMNVSYYFDWGDNTNSGWLPFVASGTIQNASHSWSKKGSFTVRVQAKDIYNGATSEWATLPVTVPVSIDIPFYHFMEQLFQCFPHAFPLLRILMGYN